MAVSLSRKYDQAFLRFAVKVSTQATCSRKAVGCVIVNDGCIASVGFNSAPAPLPTCNDAGHDLVNDSCRRVNHAEVAAISSAAKRGIATDGATAYVTCSPCYPCLRTLIQCGIVRIVYAEPFYRDVEAVTEAARLAGVSLEHVPIIDT